MNRTVLAIGLQQTGKTTFLAAFWDLLCSGEVIGSLRLDRTTGDMQYLNEIRQAWADCKPITRTGPASDKAVTMLIRDETTDIATSLEWSDMLGESFERQWTDRTWTAGYRNLVQEAVGALVFIHPSKVADPPLIVTAQRAVSSALQSHGGDSKPNAESGPIAPPTPFDGRKSATQVQLVELLQFVDRVRPEGSIRLSLIISAWDRISALMSISPSDWLRRCMPLLDQYLCANHERFDINVFGVSAQGGDYSNAAALRMAHRASNRISVVHHQQSSNDITVPVRWALGGSV